MTKGTFTSVWDSAIINTPAEVNEETGEISTNSVETGDNGSLIEEFFEDEEGDQLEVCPDCHGFVLREKCIEGEGNGNDYDGELICSNPYCDSNLTVTLICPDDVKQVADGLDIKMTDVQIEKVIELYPSEAEADADFSGAWYLVVEQCIHNVLKS